MDYDRHETFSILIEVLKRHQKCLETLKSFILVVKICLKKIVFF